MTRAKSRWKQKLLALGASSLLVLIVLGVAEIFCRYFLDINLRKTSREFVRLDANGFVTGNEPNASGISFGVPVFSDAQGFRVPLNYRPPDADSSVLLIGDSVTFGVGVPEEETFAGRLRIDFPDREMINSGVIGFSIPDYVRVSQEISPKHQEIRQVYLFYCLNDFHSADVYQPKAEDLGAWRAAKRSVAGAFIALNEFLGPRSKLYVLLTGLTIDPSSQYYQNDLKNMDVGDDRFEQVIRPVVDIAKRFESEGKGFAVVLNPYEIQLRKGSGADFAPQDRIRGYLESNGVGVIDTRERFAALKSPGEAFLFADPMHLSSLGHKLVYEAVADDLRHGR